MFDTLTIKGAHRRGDGKKVRISRHKIMDFSCPVDRRMPYFSIVPQNAAQDPTFQTLTPAEQGQFFRLVVYVLAPGCGGADDFPVGIARTLRISVSEWETLRQRYIDTGLLTLDVENGKLVQLGLREQYLDTLQSSENRAHPKKGAG